MQVFQQVFLLMLIIKEGASFDKVTSNRGACILTDVTCACTGVALLMAEVMPDEPVYAQAIQQFCNWYIPPLRSVPHTANGLAFPYKVRSTCCLIFRAGSISSLLALCPISTAS